MARFAVPAVIVVSMALFLLVRLATLGGNPSITAEVCEFGLLSEHLRGGLVLELLE